ncbi:hypothetical protein QCA50_007289 [Cerrena zonata]|uniref:F-box domain-containing protein n=1 Tax=Cerrena zonata TaxID=2478898 RepID=A0AAW0GAP7_9APHY
MDNSISLPLDIELIIIDALADLPDFEERQDYTERQECFRSLSLVCRNWTRPSQKYLFNTVQLDHISLPKFESVIMPQTELAKSFRESVVQLTFNSSLSTAKASKDWKVEKPTFSIARALMIALTLPKVATLDFISRGFSLEPPILHRLPPRFGNVRCLAIQIKEPVRLSHLAHFLSGFSSLHTLRIDVAIEPEPKDVEGKKPLLRYKYPSLPTTLYRLFLYVFPGSEPLIE